jgi:gamma-glutamyltranspeptidase / glutathione hydrolase
VNAPRFHHQWMPDVVLLEKSFSSDTVNALRHMEHSTESGGENSYWSDGECIMIDGVTGERLGASDIRNNGRAVGY